MPTPKVLIATAIDANTINFLFSEPVIGDESGWFFFINGSTPLTIDSVTGSGSDELNFIIIETMLNSDIITFGYNSLQGNITYISAPFQPLATISNADIFNDITVINSNAIIDLANFITGQPKDLEVPVYNINTGLFDMKAGSGGGGLPSGLNGQILFEDGDNNSIFGSSIKAELLYEISSIVDDNDCGFIFDADDLISEIHCIFDNENIGFYLDGNSKICTIEYNNGNNDLHNFITVNNNGIFNSINNAASTIHGHLNFDFGSGLDVQYFGSNSSTIVSTMDSTGINFEYDTDDSGNLTISKIRADENATGMEFSDSDGNDSSFTLRNSGITFTTTNSFEVGATEDINLSVGDLFIDISPTGIIFNSTDGNIQSFQIDSITILEMDTNLFNITSELANLNNNPIATIKTGATGVGAPNGNYISLEIADGTIVKVCVST